MPTKPTKRDPKPLTSAELTALKKCDSREAMESYIDKTILPARGGVMPSDWDEKVKRASWMSAPPKG